MFQIPWIALTATAPIKVQDDIRLQLRLNEDLKNFKISCFRENLYYDVVMKDAIVGESPTRHLADFVANCLNTKYADKPEVR